MSRYDLKELMRDHYLRYASYVILDRAIPDVADGLKPVQRRILHTLWKMRDGKLHKVANVAGQTMAYHPHGDAAITDALANMANKGYLLDRQGNFGNLFTGDPAAASRYIETRLSKLAEETLFNPDLTEFVPSYDGRNLEPLSLPAKIPLLLIQGAEGIAVGMSTRILPHNFKEILEAEISYLEGRPYTLLPDFPTGGEMDPSGYERGRGKVKLRAKIEVRDPKTLIISEICYGTTTDSLIRSIDDAGKKGKIKIESISDYTAERVEIEIKLPRGCYAEETVEALFAFTDCEASLSPQSLVISDNMPCEMDVHEILERHAELLQGYLRRELEIERERILQSIFEKSLERIFIENRLYRPLEAEKSLEGIHSALQEGLKPHLEELSRAPEKEDRERLLAIPIRRISRYDAEKNASEILALKKRLEEAERNLKRIPRVAVAYLKRLVKEYGEAFPRKTRISEIEAIDRRAVETRALEVGFDPESGFAGLKVKGSVKISCTNFDKLLALFDDGSFEVFSIPEKELLERGGKKLVHFGIADKKTRFSAAYLDPKTKLCFAKRFKIERFILNKSYRYFEEGMELKHLSTADELVLELKFVSKPKQRLSSARFDFASVRQKGVSAKGVRMASRPVRRISVAKEKENPQLELF